MYYCSVKALIVRPLFLSVHGIENQLVTPSAAINGSQLKTSSSLVTDVDSKQSPPRGASSVRFNITSNPMDHESKDSSAVTLCFADNDQHKCHEFNNTDEMGTKSRFCHSSPCFPSFDDTITTSLPITNWTKQGPRIQRQRRRGASPEDSKLSPSTTIKKELR